MNQKKVYTRKVGGELTLEGNLHVEVNTPTGLSVPTEIPAGTSTSVAVSKSTSAAHVTLTKAQFNGLVQRVEALESFVQSQKTGDPDITETHALEIGIPGVAKYTFKRQTTKDK